MRLSLICVLFLMLGCSEEPDPPSGTLQIKLLDPGMYEGERLSVAVKKLNGETIVAWPDYKRLPQRFVLPEGDYFINIESDQAVMAQLDELQFRKKSDIFSMNEFDVSELHIWIEHRGIAQTWVLEEYIPIPEIVDGFSFAIGDNIYVGITLTVENQALLHDFFRYSIPDDEWTQMNSLPHKVGYAQGIAVNGKGYMFYRENANENITYFYEYDEGDDDWIRLQDVDIARRFAGLFAMEDSIYFGGGGVPGGSSSTFQVFSTADGLWHNAPALPDDPFSRANSFVIEEKGHLLVGGGEVENVGDHWLFDPITDEWTMKAGYPGAGKRFNFHYGKGGYGFVGFGKNSDGEIFPDMWRYDSETDTWEFYSSYYHGRISDYVLSGSGDDYAYYLFTSEGGQHLRILYPE